MTERQTIENMAKPNTRQSIETDLRKIGLKQGAVVIVHSSLSSLGWVCGGPIAVIQALIDVVGQDGTVIMPTQTGDHSDPSGWMNPPVPKEWWETIRETMPAYDPHLTPTRGMGKIVESFRTYTGVKRSSHPTYSFAAWGKYADYIVSEQPLEAGFGHQSPLAKVYELDGNILLIGVGHDSNTSLHYAEHAIPNRSRISKGTAMVVGGQRVWKTYQEIDYDSDPFEELGEQYEENHLISQGKIGKATCKLIAQRDMVNFGRNWLIEHNLSRYNRP